MRILIITFLCFFLTACLDDLEPDDPTNANYNWPASLFGYEIGFTLETSGGSSVSTGSTIRYYYNYQGSVEGRNPDTGQTYIPESYSYSVNGNSATITVYFGYGEETYRLTPTSCTSGDYTGNSEIYGGATANSTGYYIIYDGPGIC